MRKTHTHTQKHLPPSLDAGLWHSHTIQINCAGTKLNQVFLESSQTVLAFPSVKSKPSNSHIWFKIRILIPHSGWGAGRIVSLRPAWVWGLHSEFQASQGCRETPIWKKTYLPACLPYLPASSSLSSLPSSLSWLWMANRGLEYPGYMKEDTIQSENP